MDKIDTKMHFKYKIKVEIPIFKICVAKRFIAFLNSQNKYSMY